MIRCKRVYDTPDSNDGYRVLVDRLWPRGIKKADLPYDEWAKTLTPSRELRTELHSDVIDFTEFTHRYLAELACQQPTAQALASLSKTQTVTLLYADRDTQQNHALVLADYLRSLAH
ncbi:DUF488 family protein [Citrobacter sp. JGM124]|uniref:DUF488 domain-containing protein n=1 Tax=Citrobacter sp. JGM124 TaxID=2799789 RepID=UPI001BADC18D|nr:DUF488 family protein [Citrobacter sp. JGM124]MBS0847562.1 DUF488 family protein [Citrobacter sp. JGM124]